MQTGHQAWRIHQKPHEHQHVYRQSTQQCEPHEPPPGRHAVTAAGIVLPATAPAAAGQGNFHAVQMVKPDGQRHVDGVSATTYGWPRTVIDYPGNTVRAAGESLQGGA